MQDTWFCDANLDDYEEVVVFAVNLDQWGEIRGLSLEHFTYDDGWVEWQGMGKLICSYVAGLIFYESGYFIHSFL